MLDAMIHEPFYSRGEYADSTAKLGVGWLCHRNSFCDCLPIFSQTRDVVLFFYGEEFSHQTVSSSADGNQNAKYLVELYERYGESFLNRLNGWFSGVLLDLAKGTILLFVDRIGVQRIYYYDSGDAFFFSSEAKSILRVVPSARRLSEQALGEWLALGYTLGERSLFEGVSVLPGGSCLEFSFSGCRREKKYFQPSDWENTDKLTERDYFVRFLEQWPGIVKRYQMASQPVGLSLTGGLDTRLIVAGMNRHEDRMIAYTFGGARDTFDIRASKRVAEACGLSHEVVRLDQDFFDEFPNLAQSVVYGSDGTEGILRAHDLFLFRKARELARVRLTGKFGSEVLREGRILPEESQITTVLEAETAQEVERARYRAESFRKGHPLSLAVFRDIPWRWYGRGVVEQSQLISRSPFLDVDLLRLVFGAPDGVRASKVMQQKLIESLSPEISRIVSDRGDAVGRNRVALMVYKAALWSLFKADYLYYFSAPQWVMPLDGLIGAGKLFQLPFGLQKFEHYRLWFRGALRNYIEEILFDSRTLGRQFWNAERLKHAVESHMQGRTNQSWLISKALTLELILRGLIKT